MSSVVARLGPFRPNIKGKVAIITGATRGIGREVALALASHGCNIVVAAKTVTAQPTLPGTIYTVAEEVESLGVQALPVKVDVRSEDDVNSCVQQTMDKFGRVDILINNASALWWERMEDTPMKRYDLITQVNTRGSFMFAKACAPIMAKQGWGHVINMSPPIELNHMSGKTAYNISKFGMTLVALGVAQEYRGKGVAGNTIWPATVVESLASKNFQLGSEDMWRKATIISDSVLGVLEEDPNTFTNQQLIDDEFLSTKGITDFKEYRCNPEVEPPKMNDLWHLDTFNRGTVPTDDEKKAIIEKHKKAKL